MQRMPGCDPVRHNLTAEAAWLCLSDPEQPDEGCQLPAQHAADFSCVTSWLVPVHCYRAPSAAVLQADARLLALLARRAESNLRNCASLGKQADTFCHAYICQLCCAWNVSFH